MLTISYIVIDQQITVMHWLEGWHISCCLQLVVACTCHSRSYRSSRNSSTDSSQWWHHRTETAPTHIRSTSISTLITQTLRTPRAQQICFQRKPNEIAKFIIFRQQKNETHNCGQNWWLWTDEKWHSGQHISVSINKLVAQYKISADMELTLTFQWQEI